MGNHYRLEEQLHAGPLSSVWLARQVEMDRQVVVKFFKFAKDSDRARQALAQEIHLHCRLRHPNNVQVVDTDGAIEGITVDHGPYVVLEYVPGATLRALLRQRRRLSATAVWRIALQALGALAESHANGLVHRDIKPENLMLWNPEGLEHHLKVIDYGLAASVAHQTGAGVPLAMGTPHYMAPEVARGRPATAAADIYGLGVVMYEALAGRRPFDGSESREVLRKHVFDDPAPLTTLAAVPQELAGIVHRAMQKDPSQRFVTAQAFMAALRALTWSKMARYQVSEFSPVQLEEAIETDVFEPTAWDVASGTLDDSVHVLNSDVALPVQRLQRDHLELESTKAPTIWLFTEDPATNHASVSMAAAALGQEFELHSLNAADREALLPRLIAGHVKPPWVAVFGDMHVLVQDPLLARLRWTPGMSRVLVSTHLNAEMLQTTANFAGLDRQITLPAEPDDIFAGIERMVERSRTIRQGEDQLRLALRDAVDDLERVWRAAQARGVSREDPLLDRSRGAP